MTDVRLALQSGGGRQIHVAQEAVDLTPALGGLGLQEHMRAGNRHDLCVGRMARIGSTAFRGIRRSSLPARYISGIGQRANAFGGVHTEGLCQPRQQNRWTRIAKQIAQAEHDVFRGLRSSKIATQSEQRDREMKQQRSENSPLPRGPGKLDKAGDENNRLHAVGVIGRVAHRERAGEGFGDQHHRWFFVQLFADAMEKLVIGKNLAGWIRHDSPRELRGDDVEKRLEEICGAVEAREEDERGKRHAGKGSGFRVQDVRVQEERVKGEE